MTSNSDRLSDINGVKIPLCGRPFQSKEPEPYHLNQNSQKLLDQKIYSFLEKGIVEFAEPEEGQFISNHFVKLKSDGDARVLFDLSDFNDFVPDEHFKMEDAETVKTMILPDSYMASLDWKDAYYSVKIHPSHRKYLRFYWNGKLMQYTCLPQGLKCAPRIFTKLTRVNLSVLREQGVKASNFIDDSFIIDKNLLATRRAVQKTVAISEFSGWVIHPEKSVLDPSQILQHLGFVFNSNNMTVKISDERANKIISLCKFIRVATERRRKITIRIFAKLIGCMVSTFTGNQYAKLLCRSCVNEKNINLAHNRGNFDAKMRVTNKSLAFIKVWENEAHLMNAPICRAPPSVFLESDASDISWGGVFRSKLPIHTRGSWDEFESDWHNNLKELKAACLVIMSFCKNMYDTHIKISIDNTTAVAYLHNQGGRKLYLNRLAQEIWTWARKQNNWITPVYLPGIFNKDADKQSRLKSDSSEYKLSDGMFSLICERFGNPTVDLFASRLNYKVENYYSYLFDPGASKTDAFSEPWNELLSYAFPPFNCVTRVIQKAKTEKSDLILVCPNWPGQVWYTDLIKTATKIIYFNSREVTHPWRTAPVKEYIAALLRF